MTDQTRHDLRITHAPGIGGRRVELDGQDVTRSVAAVQVTLTGQGAQAVIETLPRGAVDLELDGALVDVLDQASRLETVRAFLRDLDPEWVEDAMLEGERPGQGAIAALMAHAEEWARG